MENTTVLACFAMAGVQLIRLIQETFASAHTWD